MSALGFLLVLFVGCADTTPGRYVKVLTGTQPEELHQWILGLGIALGIETVLGLAIAAKLENGGMAVGEILNIAGIPFVWTILGEWLYRLTAWIADWGIGGRLLLSVLAVINGVLAPGGGALQALFGAGIVFHNQDLLSWFVFPAAIAGGLRVSAMLSSASRA